MVSSLLERTDIVSTMTWGQRGHIPFVQITRRTTTTLEYVWRIPKIPPVMLDFYCPLIYVKIMGFWKRKPRKYPNTFIFISTIFLNLHKDSKKLKDKGQDEYDYKVNDDNVK